MSTPGEIDPTTTDRDGAGAAGDAMGGDSAGDSNLPLPLQPQEDSDRPNLFPPTGDSTQEPDADGGEDIELGNLSKEQSGMVHGPGEPAWKALTFLFPDASATDLEAFLDPTSQRLRVKMAGAGKASYYLMTEDKITKQQHLNPKLPKEIRNALGVSASDQLLVLQQQLDRNTAEIRVRLQEREQLEANVQKLQETRQELDAIRNQISQLDNDIYTLEDKVGSLDEATIQRLKNEKRALEAERQRKREQYAQTQGKAKESLQLQTEINDLKLANRDID